MERWASVNWLDRRPIRVARLQDAAAAATGVIGRCPKHGQTGYEHPRCNPCGSRKVNTLFTGLQVTILKKIEYFGQIYKDLMAHSEAEEQVVYPAVRPFYENDTQELYDEQAQLKQMLDETKALDPPHLNSKTKSDRSWTLLATISVKKKALCLLQSAITWAAIKVSNWLPSSNQLKARCRTKWLASVTAKLIVAELDICSSHHISGGIFLFKILPKLLLPGWISSMIQSR